MGNAGAFLRDYSAGNRMGGDPLLNEEIQNPIGRGPGNPFGDAPVNPIGRAPGFPGGGGFTSSAPGFLGGGGFTSSAPGPFMPGEIEPPIDFVPGGRIPGLPPGEIVHPIGRAPRGRGGRRRGK